MNVLLTTLPVMRMLSATTPSEAMNVTAIKGLKEMV